MWMGICLLLVTFWKWHISHFEASGLCKMNDPPTTCDEEQGHWLMLQLKTNPQLQRFSLKNHLDVQVYNTATRRCKSLCKAGCWEKMSVLNIHLATTPGTTIPHDLLQISHLLHKTCHPHAPPVGPRENKRWVDESGRRWWTDTFIKFSLASLLHAEMNK